MNEKLGSTSSEGSRMNTNGSAVAGDIATAVSSPGDARTQSWPLRIKVVIGLSVTLLVFYIGAWLLLVNYASGPESFVRQLGFGPTLVGAVMVREGNGARLYDARAQREVQRRVLEPYVSREELLPFNHPPFEALILAPIIGLPYPVLFALWTLGSVVMLAAALTVMSAALPMARPLRWAVSLAACSYLPFSQSLLMGQTSAFVLEGLCGTYAALRTGHRGWAGLSLLLVALKPQFLPVVILLLVLQRHWRTLVVFASCSTVATVLVMPILGAAWPLAYLRLLLSPTQLNNTQIHPEVMHNWRGFAVNILGDTASGLVVPVFAGLSIASLSVMLFAWWRSDAQQHSFEIDSMAWPPAHDLLWALTGIVAVLVSPHLMPHDLTLLVLPGWIIVAYATSGVWSRRVSGISLLLLWIGYAAYPLGFVAPASLQVIPSVLLMAFASILLGRQIAASRRTPARLAFAERTIR